MANRYWVVGGDGNWNSTTNWSTTSGGASGASVPVSVDTVLIDANSGAGSIILDISPTIISITFNGFTGNFNFGSNTLSLNGTGTIFTGSTLMTVAGTPIVNCTNATATARTINPTNVTQLNSISFNVTAGTGTFSVGATTAVRNLNFTGFSGTWAALNNTIYGDLILSSTMTVAAGGTTTFASSTGNQTITTNAVIFDRAITQNNPGATLQLQDNLTMGSTRTFTLTAGTLDLVDKTLSTGRFACSASTTTRSVAFGTGNITLTDNSATILSWGNSNLTATGSKNIFATYAGGTGTRTFSMNSIGAVETNVPNILITAGTDIVASIARVRTLDFTGFKGTYNSATSKSIFGGLIFDPGMTITGSANSHGFAATTGPFTVKTAGLVMDFPITFAGTAIGGIWEFDDAITMGAGKTLTVNAGTVKFKAGTTNTSDTFAFSGTSAVGRQIFIQSTTPGVQYTLSQPSGTVNAAFMNIQDSNAAGGAAWNAYVDFENIDDGNNDGWNFSLSPPYASYEPPIIIRSFTQPRRF